MNPRPVMTERQLLDLCASMLDQLRRTRPDVHCITAAKALESMLPSLEGETHDWFAGTAAALTDLADEMFKRLKSLRRPEQSAAVLPFPANTGHGNDQDGGESLRPGSFPDRIPEKGE